jgi:NIPSNAP
MWRMERRTFLQGVSAAGLVQAAAMLSVAAPVEGEQVPVYELRVYHVAEGKLDALLARFQDHTVALFTRHNMRSVAYWTPLDDPLRGHTLYYILAHPSREAATANWKAFREDPEWIKVKQASEVNGSLTTSIESTFLSLTDFSPKV